MRDETVTRRCRHRSPAGDSGMVPGYRRDVPGTFPADRPLFNVGPLGHSNRPTRLASGHGYAIR